MVLFIAAEFNTTAGALQSNGQQKRAPHE